MVYISLFFISEEERLVVTMGTATMTCKNEFQIVGADRYSRLLYAWGEVLVLY